MADIDDTTGTAGSWGDRPSDRALDLRPLTARSVLASVLLGTHPPRLGAAALVASAHLFGIADGTARTALSRMVAAGELTSDGRTYGLGPELAARQQRQDVGRAPGTTPWDGRWHLLAVTATSRPAGDRVAARLELTRSRLAELREGVWVRPTNVDAPAIPGADGGEVPGWVRGVITFDTPPGVDALWDLKGWATRATRLTTALDELAVALSVGDPGPLRWGFSVAAAALRHLAADPLLPSELLADDWPGDDLRAGYDRFDEVYRRVLHESLRAGR